MPAIDEIRRVPTCRVQVDGQPLLLGTAAALVRVEADLDEQLFACCSLLLVDPHCELINGDLFGSGANVKVEMGFQGARKRIFEGEVVALEPSFLEDKPPSLRVVCFEALHRLALSQMTRSLHDVDDKQIVQQIAQSHGLQGEGPAGTREHALQGNLSDAVFLRRMAQKHGGHVRVVGRKLIVGPAAKGVEVPIRPGEGVGKIRLKVNANQQVGEVTAHGWDPRTRREFIGRAQPRDQDAREHGGSASIALAGKESLPSDTASAEGMAKARMRKLAEGLRTVQLQMTGDPRIFPGAVLQLEGFGVPFDARYRVRSAQHVWDRFGYRVRLEGVFAGRNKPARPAPPARPNGDQQDESFDLEIQLLDSQDVPQASMAYELGLPDGRKISSFTGADGLIRATSKTRGEARLDLFPDRRRPPAPPPPLTQGAQLIELQLINAAGDALPARAFQLTLPDGRVVEGLTEADGFIRARSTAVGDVKLQLPEGKAAP